MVCWGQKWHYAPLIIKLTKVQAERSPMSWIERI
ncbi:acetyl-CoA carboxylase carboxyl transferase subunit beta, partial [Salmonella enterica]|nr:acetyl-CoA carboxylase carboxyl transferase subunit beta [Salmonella enterica]